MKKLTSSSSLFRVLVLRMHALLVVMAGDFTDYHDAYATFYGGIGGWGTMGGACGYGNLYATGYGTATTALSYALFNEGLSCGACYSIVCKLEETKWCYPGKSITVTATNSCPPGSEGGWCDPPRSHFDLFFPMFKELARREGGVTPIQYKMVRCEKQGGIRFTLKGNPYFNYILVFNVGGRGDVAAFAMKAGNGNWFNMNHSWGQNWSSGQEVVGQALSFRVTLGNGDTLSTYITSLQQIGDSTKLMNRAGTKISHDYGTYNHFSL